MPNPSNAYNTYQHTQCSKYKRTQRNSQKHFALIISVTICFKVFS